MREVVDLQQQQRITVHHAGEVNQRLQSAEQRQKQMVSFLAKLFQNPAFLARLKLRKEQREIDSPRVRRKFVKQHQHEIGTSENIKEGHIVRYRHDWRNINASSETPELSPHFLSQGLATEIGADTENLTSQFENIGTDELVAMHEIMPTPEIVGEGSSGFGLEDPFFKGENVMSQNQEVPPGYFVSFPDDLTKEKGFPEFSPLGIESTIKQEDIWEADFNISAAAPSCENELWGDSFNYQVPEFGVTSGMSDIWDIGSGSLGIDKWPADESPLDEADSQDGQPKDDTSKNVDP